MNAILTFFRWIIGAVYIFSGFVKVIDPLGFTYKIIDYLEAMHLSALEGIALPMAIVMAVLELVIGFSLFFNLLPRLGALGVLLMQIIYTPLTLWLAIANPVTDCGCFGEALVITNWQTFFKNIILCVMIIPLFWKRKQIKTYYNTAIQWVVMFIVGFATLGLSIYCLKTLPIIDFRPYHVGANIAEGMVIPADAPKPVVESYFIYEKDGKQEKFTADKVPQGDPSWKFIDAVHEVIEPGYEPPIHDFTIERTFFDDNSAVDVDAIELVYTNEGGEQMFADVYSVPDESWTFDHYVCEDCEDEIDVDKIQIVYTNADGSIQTLGVDSPTSEGMTATEAHYSAGQKDIAPQVLADERYSFLMIALRLDEMDTEHLAEFDSIASFASKNNIGFYCMTSSNEDEIAAFKNEHNPSFEFYNTDPITLKTIVRSNPGLLLIRKGTVIDKWHDGNLPQIKDLQNELTGAMLSDEHNQRNMLVYALWIVGAFLGMALLKNFYNWLVKNRFINDKNSLR